MRAWTRRIRGTPGTAPPASPAPQESYPYDGGPANPVPLQIPIGAEDGFEGLDLSADGGLGDVELGGGLGEATFLGDGPEIEQVVVVDPFHATNIRRVILHVTSLFRYRRRILAALNTAP